MTNMIDRILDFWFSQSTAQQRWQKNKEYDNKIRLCFTDIYLKALAGECYTWRETPPGRLAEIIILDQFSRNMFRDTPQAFAADSIALVLAQEAVHSKMDTQLTLQQKAYLYMPYMHSESKKIHENSIILYAAKGLEENYAYEVKHKAIIDRFGRYPHRNAILNRPSTAEESVFLQQSDSHF